MFGWVKKGWRNYCCSNGDHNYVERVRIVSPAFGKLEMHCYNCGDHHLVDDDHQRPGLRETIKFERKNVGY